MKLAVEHMEGMRFRATAGEHTVEVDAAPEDGGAGAGLSAPQLFAVAVGACVLEFVVNSCRLRGVPFDHLSLEMEWEELPRPRRVGPLDVVIHMEPELAEDVKRRLIGVARHATLLNTLTRPPEVALRFAGETGKE